MAMSVRLAGCALYKTTALWYNVGVAGERHGGGRAGSEYGNNWADAGGATTPFGISPFHWEARVTIRKWPTRAGYVYFLKSGSFVKIGVTRNVERRAAQLAAQPPFYTEMIAFVWVSDAYSAETRLHLRYADARVRGEWFALDWDDIDEAVQLVRGWAVDGGA